MSEMRERVASALEEVIARPAMYPDWQSQHEAIHRFAPLKDALALAAITAMRAPTKEMEAAAEELDDWGVPSDPGSGNASALAHWTAMIDEALKEKTE